MERMGYQIQYRKDREEKAGLSSEGGKGVECLSQNLGAHARPVNERKGDDQSHSWRGAARRETSDEGGDGGGGRQKEEEERKEYRCAECHACAHHPGNTQKVPRTVDLD